MAKLTKSREVRTDIKDNRRKGKEKVASKSAILNMVEVLISNARVKNGICRHNHSITVLNTGKILVDGDSAGYIDSSFTKAAKYLIEQGYYIRYVRNSPVIHTPDGDAVTITAGDVMRFKGWR